MNAGLPVLGANLGAWSPAKVDAVRKGFGDFCQVVKINSKEKGGNYTLGQGMYYGQQKFLDTVFTGLEQDIHDFSFLKSRQLGITTITRAFSIFWVGIHDGLHGGVVFDTDPHKEQARREIEAMLDSLPDWFNFPRIKVRNRYGIILDNNAQLEFMSAGVKQSKSSGTLGRSSGLAFCHLSELCSYENVEGLISLQQTFADENPDRLYIKESTGRGFNQWHEMWSEAKEDTLNQMTCFLGWWSKDSQQFARGTARFDRYGLATPTEDEARKILEVHDRYGFQITAEQLAWIRYKTDPSQGKSQDDLGDGYLEAEQAWTEEDAFQQAGADFFPLDSLNRIASKTINHKHTGYKYYPGLDFMTTQVTKATTFRQVQLKVWEEPDPEGVYIIGADPAFGHDENNDRSALQVIRCYADCVEQVAEFASPSFPTNHFAWVIASVAGWYKNINQLVVEVNGPGEAVWSELKNLKTMMMAGYMRREAQEKGLTDIFNNVRNYVYTRTDSMTGGSAWHFKTNTQLKVQIMELLNALVNSDKILIRSQDTLAEMKSVTREGDSIKAQGSKKDDRVMAMAMAVRAWEEKVRLGLSAQNRTKAAEVVRMSQSPKALYELFQQNMLTDFFAQKRLAALRNNQQTARSTYRRRTY